MTSQGDEDGDLEFCLGLLESRMDRPRLIFYTMFRSFGASRMCAGRREFVVGKGNLNQMLHYLS